MTEERSTELIFISFTLLLGNVVAALNCTSPTPEALFDALNDSLFTKNLIRPVKTFSHPVNISISITLVGILGVNEKSQILTTVLWQVLQWNIEGLSWDKEQCGTSRVSVLRENLWVPDIEIAEFMEEDKSPQTPYVYLYDTGLVYDDKPVRVVSSCRLVIYTFPFDIQNCSLTFGSYLHFASDISLFPDITAGETLQQSRNVLQTNGEWELTNITIAHSTLVLGVGNYSEVKYFIILRRRPLLYVVNLLLPSCFLITLDLFSFLLPPQSVDRSSFKMTLILGYTVFLLIMNDLLPVTGETTPLINIFFSISLALMVASLLETVFITNIQISSSQYSPVPRWLSVVVLQYLAVVVCIPPKKKTNRVTVFFNRSTGDPTLNSSVPVGEHQSLSNTGPNIKYTDRDLALEELKKLSRDLLAIRLQMDKHFLGNNTSEEWQMIGVVIDRLLFGLYIVFITVSFVTIICIWVYSNFNVTRFTSGFKYPF